MEKNWENTIPARDASKCAGQLVKLTSPVFGVFVVCFGCFFLKFLCNCGRGYGSPVDAMRALKMDILFRAFIMVSREFRLSTVLNVWSLLY